MTRRACSTQRTSGRKVETENRRIPSCVNGTFGCLCDTVILVSWSFCEWFLNIIERAKIIRQQLEQYLILIVKLGSVYVLYCFVIMESKWKGIETYHELPCHFSRARAI